MNKKLLLGFGTILTIVTPIIAVVSCTKSQTPEQRVGEIHTQTWAVSNGYQELDGIIHTTYGIHGANNNDVIEDRNAWIRWTWYTKDGKNIKVYIGGTIGIKETPTHSGIHHGVHHEPIIGGE